MKRDSVLGTLMVAAVLCVVCSVIVSSAAVGLRSRQESNKQLYERTNILLAAGLLDEDEPADTVKVEQLFENIETEIIDLETGKQVEDGILDESYDQKIAAKTPDLSVEIDPEKDLAGIRRREKYSRVYLVKESGKIKQVILPVYGKGLWSTMYGFLAIKSDLKTVGGLTFYSHGETPGLGGEIESQAFKTQWPGKLLYDDEGKLQIEVIKGKVVPGSAKEQHQIDGLSGATITSRGVSNLIRYWVGDAFQPYLTELSQQMSGENNG